MLITFTNDFHNTRISVRPKDGALSLGQCIKIRRTLCPARECHCGESDLHTRGPQPVYIECLWDPRGNFAGVRLLPREH